jgi:hypothetical protein
MVDDLLAEIGKVCVRGLEAAGANRPHLQTIVEALGRPRRTQDVTPHRPELIAEPLATALIAARDGANAPLGDAIEACADRLLWRQTFELYGRDPGLDAFQRTYAFASAMAPEARGAFSPRVNEHATVGLTIQGPNTTYPAHAHRAIEVYYVIAGTADWKQGTAPWRDRPPGTFIVHGPDEPHAMRTGAEPLLTFFAWVSDLNSTVAMVPD